MISSTRLQKLFLLLVLLLPSGPGMDALGNGAEGLGIAPVAFASGEELLQPRGTKHTLSSSVDRDYGSGDRTPVAHRGSHTAGAAPIPVAPALEAQQDHSVRPAAERLPYDATAPPVA